MTKISFHFIFFLVNYAFKYDWWKPQGGVKVQQNQFNMNIIVNSLLLAAIRRFQGSFRSVFVYRAVSGAGYKHS